MIIGFIFIFLVLACCRFELIWGFVRKRTCFFVLLIFISIDTQAQDTLSISLNGTIPFNFSPNSYVFDVEFNKNTRNRFDDKKMSSYIFKKPGITKIYPISIHKHDKDHDCSIIHLPDSIIILTDHFKMEFIDSSFKILNPILKNKDTKGNYIEIQILVSNTYKNFPILLKNKALYTAGIGTKISGELDANCIRLKKGINTLRYYLKGICSMNSYIQFDFIDNTGKAHSISLNSPIKDI